MSKFTIILARLWNVMNTSRYLPVLISSFELYIFVVGDIKFVKMIT